MSETPARPSHVSASYACQVKRVFPAGRRHALELGGIQILIPSNLFSILPWYTVLP